jgi:hypothetical protein
MAAPATKKTGHKATLMYAAIGTSTPAVWSASLISIGSFEMTRQELECTGLDTVDYEEFLPGDTVNPGEIEVEYFFNVGGTSASSPMPPITGSVASILITIYNSVTDASFAFNGFITSFTSPELVTNSIMKGKAKIKITGAVTFVAGVD